MDSDWTRWAKERGLEIHITSPYFEEVFKSTVGGAHIFEDEYGRRFFFLNHWSKYIVREWKKEWIIKKFDQ